MFVSSDVVVTISFPSKDTAIIRSDDVTKVSVQHLPAKCFMFV